MLLKLGIHLIPRLRAGDKDVHHRFVGRRVVQAGRLQSEDTGPPFRFNCDWALAAWAKPAFSRLAGLPNNFIVMQLPAYLDSGFRHRNDCRIGAAASLLAVPTMTVQHKDWISMAPVTDGATRTPAK